MSRYRGSVCRLCRRENLKLYLKGDRCYSDKCAFDRRGYPPGQHGQRRGSKVSDYGRQLREKQKVKRSYCLSEKQFKLTFEKADSKKELPALIYWFYLNSAWTMLFIDWDSRIHGLRPVNWSGMVILWLMAEKLISHRTRSKSGMLSKFVRKAVTSR